MQCPEQLRLEQFYESALRRCRLRAHMLTIAPGRVKVFRVLVVSIGLLALVALSIAVGVHAFLAAVGHYAPWEQIWAG
jgi:hypothetical protein